VSRDIWGGRLSKERFIPKNKNFNSINYNLSGNLLIAGGNSQYVCLYDMHYQILIKKFCLTHNRSLDGILHKLNSKYLKEGNQADIDGYQDSEEERGDEFENLPGVTKNKFAIKIISVKFSNTNRSFAIGTNEGIYIYSLDTLMSFSPLQLGIEVTTSSALEAFNQGSYLKALVFSFYLNKNDLMNKFINSIPNSQITIIVNKLPFNIVGPLLDFLAKKIENDRQIQLYMIWVFNLLKYHGQSLKKVNKNVFLNLHKSINKTMKSMNNMVEENIFNIRYITEYEPDETTVDNL
jgi:periodic tryptophan protein 2